MFAGSIASQGFSSFVATCNCTLHVSILFDIFAFQRNWKNDAHMAIRDCYRAVEIDPTSVRALLCMAEALLQVNN